MAFTILTHFRLITKYDSNKIADATVRTDYMAPALARYNGIMGTSLTITDDTTGSTVPDMAIAWLSAAMRYAEDKTISRNVLTGGLLSHEIWEQQAFKVMAEIDPSKFDFKANLGLWIPKLSTTWVNMYRRDDAKDTETYG